MHIPNGRAEELYRELVAFEKQHVDEVRKNLLNCDSWFDSIRLKESVDLGNKERARAVL